MLSILLSHALNIGLGVLLLLVAVYTPSLMKWGRAHIQNKAAGEAFALVSARIALGVAARADKIRKMKDPNNTAAGNWTPAAGQRELAAVLSDVVADVPTQIAQIRKGLASGRTLEAVLHDMGEAAVEELRRSTPTSATAILTESLAAPSPITVNVTTTPSDDPDKVAQAVQQGVREALGAGGAVPR